MSTNDNSLYGFLKTKGSVFSPSKVARKRSRSKSRDSRNFEQKNRNPNSNEERREEVVNKPNPIFSGYNAPIADNLQKNFGNPTSNNYQNNNYPNNNFQGNNNNYQPNTYQPNNNYSPKNYQGNNNNFQGNNSFSNTNNTRPQFETPVQKLTSEQPTGYRYDDSASQASQNSMWTGILSYSSSFESARVQSSQCLENLSLKIRKEISNINSKIDIFNSRMSSTLNNEFRAIREKILQVFEAAFKESDKYIQEYMKAKEAQLAGELTKMKVSLQKELLKIDTMKDELAKPQWRKVAGQILSTEFQHRVEQLVQKSSAMQVGKWQLGDIAGYRVKNIESQLKQVIRLKA